MADPFECSGKNFHGDLELLDMDWSWTEATTVVLCHDCEKRITCFVDFKHADAHFEAEKTV